MRCSRASHTPAVKPPETYLPPKCSKKLPLSAILALRLNGRWAGPVTTAQSIKPVWVMEEMHVLDIILVIDATHSIQVLEA